MWKVLDKELTPLPNQLVGFRPGMQCLDIVSLLVESLRKADEWGEKLFVVSKDVASAFDSVSAQVLGDVLLERGATTIISSAAVVRENLELSGTSVFGVHKECFVQLGRGHETGRPKNTFWLDPGHGCVGRGIAAAVGWTGSGGVLGSEWVSFEILVWSDNIFMVSSSIADIRKKTQEIAHVFGKKDLRFNQSS